MKRIKILLTFLLVCVAAFAQDTSTTSHSPDPLEVVTQFLTAYQTGDHAKFASLLHADVMWVQPGDNRIAGVKTSKTELLQMGAQMAKLSAGSIRLTTVTCYDAHKNTVACVLHWEAAQPPGGILNVDNIDIYTVENGKIILAKVYSQDIAQENRFWGK